MIAVEGVDLEAFPLPGLITDLVLSMDDRFLYFSELAARRFAPVRRLRPSQPEADRPALAQGLLGKPSDAGRELNGGPQMLQLSFDGRRLYVSNSPPYSTWDNQFYPGLDPWLLRVNAAIRREEWRSTATSSSTCTTGRVGRLGRTVRLQGGDCRRRSSGEPPSRPLTEMMTLGHIMGLPVEETVLQALVVGTATGTTIGLACCMMLDRLMTRLRRR